MNVQEYSEHCREYKAARKLYKQSISDEMMRSIKDAMRQRLTIGHQIDDIKKNYKDKIYDLATRLGSRSQKFKDQAAELRKRRDIAIAELKDLIETYECEAIMHRLELETSAEHTLAAMKADHMECLAKHEQWLAERREQKKLDKQNKSN